MGSRTKFWESGNPTKAGNCSHGTARFHGLFLSRHGTARGHNPRVYHSTARHGELLLHFTGLHGRKPCGKRQHPSVLWPVKPSECMARHGRDNYSHCTAFHGTGCLHYKTSRHGTALHGRFLKGCIRAAKIHSGGIRDPSLL